MLKPLLMAAALALPLSAFAADEPKKPTPAQQKQQQKMADCNKQAGEKKLAGDERKKFMSQCLSADGAPATEAKKDVSAQQQKMADCNKQAGEKKLASDERKKFMSACLKG
ncbi:MAG: PsiF family protein [Betaproteobacteria bacterium]